MTRPRINRQAFFEEARQQTDASMQVLVEQLRAQWPVAESISAMLLSVYLMGLRVGLGAGVQDVALARVISDWMVKDIESAGSAMGIGAISSMTTELMDAKVEALLDLVKV